MSVVLAGCYFPTAFYPDAERVIWMRSRNSELAYCSRNENFLILRFQKKIIVQNTNM